MSHWPVHHILFVSDYYPLKILCDLLSVACGSASPLLFLLISDQRKSGREVRVSCLAFHAPLKEKRVVLHWGNEVIFLVKACFITCSPVAWYGKLVSILFRFSFVSHAKRGRGQNHWHEHFLKGWGLTQMYLLKFTSLSFIEWKTVNLENNHL